MSNIKAVIFDWGRTLWDHETEDLMEGAREVLDYCAKEYILGLVSLTTRESVEERKQKIRHLDLQKYFFSMELVSDNKDAAYGRAVNRLGGPYHKIAIIDDRTARGIKWGNEHGCVTIWLSKGKFAHELPSEETGQPTYTIHELKELLKFL